MVGVSIDISKVSSKGQVVIPKNMRNQFKEGDEVVFIQEGNKIVLKNTNELSENFKEDLEFSKGIEEAYQRYDRGEFISMSKEEFLEDLEKW